MSLKDMRYQLTTPSGKILGFYLEGIAHLYQKIWGGTLVDTLQERASSISIKPQDKRVA